LHKINNKPYLESTKQGLLLGANAKLITDDATHRYTYLKSKGTSSPKERNRIQACNMSCGKSLTPHSMILASRNAPTKYMQNSLV